MRYIHVRMLAVTLGVLGLAASATAEPRQIQRFRGDGRAPRVTTPVPRTLPALRIEDRRRDSRNDFGDEVHRGFPWLLGARFFHQM